MPTFQFDAPSPRQVRILNWWDDPKYSELDGIICDGSIRSGKTLPMAISFIAWAFSQYDGEAFGLCGKTVGAFRRNVLRKYIIPILPASGYVISDKRAENAITIRNTEGKTNTFYIFGGRDERAQDTVQGATLAGALFDEVALMPESFVNQVIARCSVTGSKLWFNCNPEYPAHWFHQEWIKQCTEKRMLYLHFTMDDNPSLAENVRERYKRLYTGVFYKRFILGLWTAATGVIYQQIADDPEAFVIDETPPLMGVMIGVDFGGTKSAHAFEAVGFTAGYKSVIVCDEYYHNNVKDGRLSPSDLERDFVEFVKRVRSKYRILGIFADSAEQTLIEGFQLALIRAKVPYEVRNAQKRPIHERIAFYNALISQGRFFICKHCKAVLGAMQEAVYKEGLTDQRLDNGTTNIDSLDALEYSTESIQDEILAIG